MAELRERAELSERVMDLERRERIAGEYLEASREAAANGLTDMARYYREKAAEVREDRPERPETASDEGNDGAGKDMAAYYEAKKQRYKEELEQRQQEWRMDKAVHGAPKYSGVSGWSESEYLYEADKEYKKNGDTPEHRRLLDEAAEAHVRAKYRDILK